MIREKITDPWREVSWDEAIKYAADRFKAVQAKYGKGSIGGITSSRTTNEEVYVVQRMVRAAFGNNNVDTCARVCHSPTGYGLKQTFGEVRRHAGLQERRQVRRHHGHRRQPDRRPSGVRLAHEEAPARRRQASSSSIRAAPTSCAAPHVEADYHLQLQSEHQRRRAQRDDPRHRHRGPRSTAASSPRVATRTTTPAGRSSSRIPSTRPKRWKTITGVPAEQIRGAARLFATGGNAAIYYGLGVTEHSQGSTTVMAMANLAMVTGNIGHEGVGVNPLRGQNNVQGSCDMGSFPHEFPGYRHVSNEATRKLFEKEWRVELSGEPGLRIPNMFDEAAERHLQGPVRARRGHRPVRSQHPPRRARARVAGHRRRAGSVPERDGGLRARLLPRHVVPREGRHLHQRRAPREPRASGDAREAGHGRVGDRLPPRHRHGLPDDVHVGRRHHGRDRPHHADLQEHLVQAARRARQRAVAVRRRGAGRHPDHAHRGVHARQGPLHADRVRADAGALQPQLPAHPHHRPHPQPVQRRRPDAAHRERHLVSRRTSSRCIRAMPRCVASRTARWPR